MQYDNLRQQVPLEQQEGFKAFKNHLASINKNLLNEEDYDLATAYNAALRNPELFRVAANGHLNDIGKMPNHITFSDGSAFHDPSKGLVGGHWQYTGPKGLEESNNSYVFTIPSNGHNSSDFKGLANYFAKAEKGNAVLDLRNGGGFYYSPLDMYSKENALENSVRNYYRR